MSPQTVESRLKELKELDHRIVRLSQVKAILEWDQETNLPPLGVEERSEQLALLGGLVHELRTNPKLGRLAEELSAETLPSVEDKAMVRLHKKAYERATKLPQDLVEQKARLVGLSQASWAQARKQNDFNLFEPYLAQLVAIARQEADLIGFDGHPYDALLEEYEPFTTSAEVMNVFEGLEVGVAKLVRTIGERPQVDDSFLHGSFPKDRQERLGREIISQIGFDSRAGRLDVTTHPFCTTLGPQDVRITTRYDESFLNTSLYGMIHETGHALYEQGVDPKFGGTILGGGTSLGIHESQSRFWENLIGRSKPFIEHYFALFQETFPESLRGVTADQFYKGINRVKPSFIRVEADEVTYSLHIILRFRMERNLLDGSLKTKDVPEAWNALSQKLLGITPPSDAEGCLQDIHWSMGGLGYFPTYALGNLYSAQFFHFMKKAIPDWDARIKTGDFKPFLEWLRTNVHRHGSVYPAGELCKKVTGEPLNPKYFLDYLQEKFGGVYGF